MTAQPAPTKAAWRARLLSARRARSEVERAAARSAIGGHLLAALGSVRRGGARPVVAAYLPLPEEPLPPELPERLCAAGWRVLLPVTVPGRALEWGWWTPPVGGCSRSDGNDGTDPSLARGAFGIAEPTGPRLGAAAIRSAAVVLVPALAVDESGFRLGRGGGFYDRSLALLGPRWYAAGARTVAVVFDDEVALPIPHESFDRPVRHIVSPSGGLVPVPLTRR